MAKKPHLLDHPNWGGIGAIATIIGSIAALVALVPVFKDLLTEKAPSVASTSTNAAGESKSESNEPISRTQTQLPALVPTVTTPSFVYVDGPKQTRVRVEVDPSGLSIYDPSFTRKIYAAGDAIAPKIKACFADYQASYKFEVGILVNVEADKEGIVVPRNEITFPEGTAIPDDNMEKVKDVISQSSFPPPSDDSSHAAGDKYCFLLKVTFVPAGS